MKIRPDNLKRIEYECTLLRCTPEHLYRLMPHLFTEVKEEIKEEKIEEEIVEEIRTQSAEVSQNITEKQMDSAVSNYENECYMDDDDATYSTSG